MPGLFFYCFRGAAVCSAALCGLRPRHFALAFMRNYIALKHRYIFSLSVESLVPIRNYIALKRRHGYAEENHSLVPIRNYIALKLRVADADDNRCLVPIRNYIALKHGIVDQKQHICLVPIRNYIALKHFDSSNGLFSKFSTYTKLHRSKTNFAFRKR